MVVWGAAAGDAVVQMVVVLGDASSAGGEAEAWRSCCGRVCSASFDPVAVRRVADAAVYKVEQRFLPGGRRYSGDAVV